MDRDVAAMSRAASTHRETRRRPSDAVRVVIAVTLVVAAVPVLSSDVPHGLLQVVTAPGSGWHRLAVATFWFGAVGAPIAAALGIVLGRATRALRSLLVGIVASVALVAAVPLPWVGGGDAEAALAALAAAVMASFSGELVPGRRSRRIVGWSTVAAAVSGVIGGVVFGTDVGVVGLIGWAVAAGVRLTFGSAQAVPSAIEITAGAAELGVPIAALELQPEQRWGLASFTAVDGAAQAIDLAVYRRDAADAQFLARLWRSIWFKDAAPSPTLTRLQQVEHEAWVLVAARRAGAQVPSVVAAGITQASGDALLVTTAPAGRLLSGFPASAVDDELLDRVWTGVAALHAARIRHGHLTTDDVTIGADGHPTLTGLHQAETGASTAATAIDVAELLTGLALQVGPDRAAASAARVLGSSRLGEVLSVLQPAALLPTTRRRVKGEDDLLERLRLAGATAAAIDAPEIAELHRVSVSDVLMLVASGFGVFLIADQIGSLVGLGPAVADAQLAYLLLAMVLGALTAVTTATAMTGAIASPLPFGPVVGVQLANQFSGLIGGTFAITATNIRFVQKRGLNPALAVSSGITTSLAGFAFQLLIIVVSLVVASPDFALEPTSEPRTALLAGLFLIAVVVGVAVGVPRFRRLVTDRVRAPTVAVLENFRQLLREPSQIGRVAVGVVSTQLLYAIALWCALAAFDVHVPLFALLLLNTLAALLGGLAPVPGGLGVIEGVLIEGLKALGVPDATATVAVLSYRLVTAYLPPIWGWVALSWLRRHDYL